VQTLRAQFFVPSPENAFSKEFAFQASQVSHNQIRKIVFEILDKKDYDIPINKNLIEYYEFNDKGYVNKYYYTDVIKVIEKQISVPAVYRRGRLSRPAHTDVFNQYIVDTIGTVFFYDTDNTLLMRRYHDGAGYYESRYYHYDSLGYQVKENRYRETNQSVHKSIFILGNQVLISTDSMQWIHYSQNQSKGLFFNNEKRPYKELILLRKDSLLYESSESYVSASWIRQVKTFEYNSKKQLTKASFKTNANSNSNLEWRYEYEYDDHGWLLNVKHYKNDLLLTETGYVNDYRANLVNSIVIRDFPNKSIRIIKLKYEYFDTLQVKGK
jgi:hypothetical protein